MATMQNTISYLQGEIKNLKSKLSGKSTKRTGTPPQKKGNWWSNPYWRTNVVGRNNGEACFKKIRQPQGEINIPKQDEW